MELKEHEVSVEHKVTGEKFAVSFDYYSKNQGSLKMLDDNGMKNKMAEQPTKENKEPGKEKDDDK